MTLQKTTEAEDPKSEEMFSEIFDKAQSKQLTDFGDTVPEGEMGGERLGIYTSGATKRVYFRCPDGSWCYVALSS